MRPSHIILALTCSTSLLLHGATPAEKADAAFPAWQTRSFNLPQDFPANVSGPSPDMDVTVPSSQPNQASDEAAWIEHIKQATVLMRALFGQLDLKLPPGTSFALDRKSQTFAVHTGPEEMAAIRSFCEGALRGKPLHLVLQINVVQADGPLLRKIIAQSEVQGDMASAWKQLQDLADQGKARILQTAHLETLSGQRTSLDSGAQRSHLTGFKLDAQGRTDEKQELRGTGLHFGVDAVIGPDDRTVDLSFAFEYHFAPPTDHLTFAGQAGTLGRIEVPVTDLHFVKLTTGMTFSSGMTRLIGVWKPLGVPELEKQDLLQAAFMRVSFLGLQQTENHVLAAALDQYAEKAVPVPPEARHRVAPIPAGMERRIFRVFPSFLELGDNPVPDNTPPAPAPLDPFIHPGAAPPQKRLWMAREILKAAEVAFPEGASAVFDADSCVLTVINTPPNLEAVQAFIDSILYHDPGQGVVHTLHIIQADAATLRQMADETATNPDCATAVQKLEAMAAQGKATFVSTQRLETRSGQKALMQAGVERLEVTRFRKSDSHGEMTGAVEPAFSGTKLETDPVVGPDGYMIDLSCSLEHHFLPPSMHQQGGNDDGKTRQIEIAGTETHAAKVTTATTMWTRTTRLIALWQPEGLPPRDGKDQLQAAFLTVTYLHFSWRDRAAAPDPK